MFTECLRGVVSIKTFSWKSNEKLDKTNNAVVYAGDIFTSKDNEILPEIVNSLFWMSYRGNFQRISDTDLSTDLGWGCTIRSTQMIVAEALRRLFLGPLWTKYNGIKENTLNNKIYGDILTLFLDLENDSCPFSIQNICKKSHEYNKKYGEWFGSSETCQIIAIIHQEYQSLGTINHLYPYDLLSYINIYVINDGIINDSYIHELFLPKSPHPYFYQNTYSPLLTNSIYTCRPLLLFIPLKTGLNTIDPDFQKCLFFLLSLPTSLGMITGTPKHSLYCFSIIHKLLSNMNRKREPIHTNNIYNYLYEDNEGNHPYDLLCLDPHQLQPSIVNPYIHDTYPFIENINNSYHTSDAIISLPIESIDPSICLGFLFKTEDEYNEFKSIVTILKSNNFNTIFSFMNQNNHEIKSPISLDDYILL
ncbi:hypothetical protein WA158_005325 [Blastocystis sp. Blastoise]